MVVSLLYIIMTLYNNDSISLLSHYSLKLCFDGHQFALYNNDSISWLSHYYIKLCLVGCQFAFYLYLQHNGMDKVKTRVKH